MPMDRNEKLFHVPLRIDARVADVQSRERPYAAGPFLRCALGIVDEFGEVDAITVRDCDPLDTADHKLYWPLTIARRWRFARGGMHAVGEDMTQAQKECILAAVERAVQRQADLKADSESRTVAKT